MMDTTKAADNIASDEFSRDIAGLAPATATQVVDLTDGDTFDLVAAPVRKQIGDAEVRMLAYNGSVPGPTLRVRQDAEVTINFTNQIDLESTVHWHGLRLENQYDGTHETQAPVPEGGSFAYRVVFPDPGVYWYHPHIREDYGQEMGLYGNVLVTPTEPDYWPPAHRDVLLTLDDILLEDDKVASFSRSETNYTAMGRFGNVLLVGGEPSLSLTAQAGEVVRFYLTNTANTRVFNVGMQGTRMKLVGGDSGRCEREEFVENVVLAPSERVVVDVLFDKSGQVTLEHYTPDRTYVLATIVVSEDQVMPALAEQFEILRSNSEFHAERQRLSHHLDAAPDKTVAFVAEMDLGSPEGPVVYTCPMHPEVVSEEPGRCPKCGMTLLAMSAPEPATTFVCPMHPEVVSNEPGSCPKCGMKLLPAALIGQTSGHERHEMTGHHMEDHGHHQALTEHHIDTHEQQHESHGHGTHEHHTGDGIEWEDDMVEVNRMTTPANMRWKIVDQTTGAENHAINWQFNVGDRVKIRLVNEMDSDHPMHHPFHIHGAGRFLVLSRDGVAESNLMWKDTVLVRTGQTVDILLEVTNPGVWMAHCHIAEHHEGGMMFSFHVGE